MVPSNMAVLVNSSDCPSEDDLSCALAHMGCHTMQAVDLVISFILTFFHLSWASWLSLIITIVIVSVDLSR